MSQAVVILLDRVRATRDRATRVWHLAGRVLTPDVAERLARFAVELEEQADRLEARAMELRKSVARTQTLTTEIARLLEETRKTVEGMKKKPG